MMPPDEKRPQFEETALVHLDAVHRLARRLTANAEDAKDLVQETLLRAYRTFDNFRAGTNCKAWLFTILYSIFVNRYRKAKREPTSVSLEEIEERFQRALSSGPEDRVSTEWTDPEVETAFRGLPENFQTVILLVDVEELSYEEAAEALGCPVGTIRSRLFRARQQLFAALKAHAQRSGYLRNQDKGE